MNRHRIFYIYIIFVVILCSCAQKNGPSVVKIYDKVTDRSELSIVLLDQKRSLRILACDGMAIPQTARYLLVQPGRHELIFSISGQTLVEVYKMTNKKYLDAVGGHTYLLKSETGFFSVGDKWFPVIVDVTDDPNLHIKNIPLNEVVTNGH